MHAVGWQKCVWIERDRRRVLFADRCGDRRPQPRYVVVLGARPHQHADNGQRAGRLAMHEVHFHRELFAVKAMLARIVEMRLQQIKTLIVERHERPFPDLDLDGVAVIENPPRASAPDRDEIGLIDKRGGFQIDRRLARPARARRRVRRGCAPLVLMVIGPMRRRDRLVIRLAITGGGNRRAGVQAAALAAGQA